MASQNSDDAYIFLRLESFAHPVIFPTEVYQASYRDSVVPFETIPEKERTVIEKVITSDPLTKITPETARLLWAHRFHLMTRPESLPKLLLSARWNILDDVVECKKLLQSWLPISAEAALELLDANFADADVRAYGVRQLEGMSDAQVLDYLLQLVQVLKYEPYLDCALARFLLKRSLNNKLVGHYFFWYLKVCHFTGWCDFILCAVGDGRSHGITSVRIASRSIPSRFWILHG